MHAIDSAHNMTLGRRSTENLSIKNLPTENLSINNLSTENHLLGSLPKAHNATESFPKQSALTEILPADPTLPEDYLAYTHCLVIKLGYRGGAFSGFAEQKSARTVAGELRRALETLLRRRIDLVCAGRTDAGVHALGQFVSIPLCKGELLDRTKQRLMISLSSLTPDDIAIKDIFLANANFSARFDALARRYRYRIYDGVSRPVLAWHHAWWHHGALDEKRMDKAAASLIGEHDFVSFCKAISAKDQPTKRNVISLSVTRILEAGEPIVCIDIVGNAFLHNMVRTIAGTLAEVGRGHKKASWVEDVLNARDRRAAGPCAPAQGLCFVEACYPEELLLPWYQTLNQPLD